jgi:trypsin
MASKLLSAGVFMLSLAHAMPQSNTPRYELDPREGKIVGGEPAEFGEFPFIVSITTKSLPDLNRCGGTLLDATTVLTAGHCSIFDPEDVVIRAGTLVGHLLSPCACYTTRIRGTRIGPWCAMTDERQNFKEGGQQAEVESIIVHPEYAEVGPEETPVNDVAIWKLKRPIELDDTVGFATLPSAGSDPRVNSTVTTAGWYVRRNNPCRYEFYSDVTKGELWSPRAKAQTSC